ncbi:sensor histidine kinase [Cloacibacterium sp. TD35]|uniref:sensor histidine kinase n=1 Tax=Cloacibacterium sp. TD35 TaxID=2976818 RepID=UPI00237D8A21|nr:ATP-binding protein [Cloacibacterium sp. TD35]WDT67511.1 histidine kinase [Cloacibacterium sp. TD35]
MLANFFYKSVCTKSKKVVGLFFIVLSSFLFSQEASILENITEAEGLPSNYVFNANEDQNGVIWLGTDKGLATYQDGRWITLDVDNGMPGNYIFHAIADKKNGLVVYLSERGLYYFDTNKRRITVKYPDLGNLVLKGLKISPYDKNYILVYCIDFSKKEEKFFAINIQNVKTLIPLLRERNNIFLVKNTTKTKLAEADFFLRKEVIKFNNTSLEEVDNGIIRRKNNKIIDTLSEKNGLGNNHINQILKTKKYVIISSQGGGIYIIRENTPKVTYNVKSTNARAVMTHKNMEYVLSDGILYIISNDKIRSKILVRKDAFTFFIDEKYIYLGSFAGLETYKLNGNQLKLISTFPLTSGVSKILKINNQIIFTTYGGGIFVQEGNSFVRHHNKPFNNIENFFKIKNGYAMISYESGISLLDENFKFLNHITRKNGLHSNFITTAFSDNDTTYIGARKGVSLLYKNKVVKTFNKDNGFKGNVTRLIFRDIHHKMWILTDQELMLKYKNNLRPVGSLRLLDNHEDLILKGSYSPENHQLTIVTKNKISVVDLSKIVPNSYVRDTYLTRVYSNGEKIDLNKKIYFEDHNKNLQFVFSSIDKDILGNTILFYKINNEAWKPFKEPRTLKFSHIDQGDFTLAIKAVNEDGYEKIVPGKIEFTVLGPFYIRLWFIFLSVLVIGVFLYSYLNEINKKKYIKKLNQLRVKHQLENERKRISRDLHDNIGAYVASLISKIDKLKHSDNTKDNGLVSYDDVRLDAEKILALLRQTIWILGNKDTNLIALYDNFKTYALKFLQTDEIRIIFEEEIENNRKFNATTGSGIFRIIQEALQNIYKHAHATKIEVNIISKDKIIIYLKDNGKGFKTENLKEGFGLQNMKERARELGFKFNIYSDVSGTTIELYEI